MATAEYMRKWREKNRQKYKQYLREWHEKNAKHVKQYAKSYKESHREYFKKWISNWEKSNPEKFKVTKMTVAANRDYPGHLTIQDVFSVIKKCKGICYWCKKPIQMTEYSLEHLKPKNDVKYLAIACKPCNSSRFDRIGKYLTPEERKDHKRALHRVTNRRWHERHKDEPEFRDRLRENQKRYREKVLVNK